MSELLTQIKQDMKEAMRAKQKVRLTAIRMLLAQVKQIEVDERKEVNDTDLLAIIDKMIKQRKDSIEQFKQAGRDELADNEAEEIEALQAYMPQALSESEINTLIDEAFAQAKPESMRDMGKVMGILKPQIQGRADMAAVSNLVKNKLG
jgi:uncharacterized protein YqeY